MKDETITREDAAYIIVTWLTDNSRYDEKGITLTSDEALAILDYVMEDQ